MPVWHLSKGKDHFVLFLRKGRIAGNTIIVYNGVRMMKEVQIPFPYSHQTARSEQS